MQNWKEPWQELERPLRCWSKLHEPCNNSENKIKIDTKSKKSDLQNLTSMINASRIKLDCTSLWELRGNARTRIQTNQYQHIFFAWTHEGFVLLVTWLDGNLVIAPASITEEKKTLSRIIPNVMTLANEVNTLDAKLNKSRLLKSWNTTQYSCKFWQWNWISNREIEFPTGTPAKTPTQSGATLTFI